MLSSGSEVAMSGGAVGLKEGGVRSCYCCCDVGVTGKKSYLINTKPVLQGVYEFGEVS